MGRIELSDEQRAVVEHPADGGNLLVLAAPGSGKTRVIVERIDWLIRQGVPPERILAMTFTRRAAGELQQRLEDHRGEVWAGTFHSICVDLLEDLGDRAGAPRPLRIADDHRQRELLERAAASCGHGLALDPEQRRRDLQRLMTAVSKRRMLLGAGEPVPDNPVLDPLLRWYDRWLREDGLLDYDDLLLLATRALARAPEERPPRLREVSYLFIDEFHDVSPPQERLIRAIAPPGGGPPVTVVADRDQAIFGFLDARLEALDRYQRDYAPTCRELSVNYRSTSSIVAAARMLMRGSGRGRGIAPKPGAAEGLPVQPLRCDDRAHEGAQVVRLVRRLQDHGFYAPGDIAVLYRTHDRANAAEQALLEAGIPVHRVQPGRFFAQDGVRDVVRLLDLALALRDDGFRNALNWPRAAVDEVSMAQLRKLARAEGIALADLARTADLYPEEISPLTRAALRDLVDLVDEHLADAAEMPVDRVVHRLLPLLAARRSPFPHRARQIGQPGAWDELLDRTGAHLKPHAERLLEAIRRKREIAISTDGSADALAAQAILGHVMDTYLDRPATLLAPGRFARDGAFAIALGRRQAPGIMGFGLAREETASIAMQAWRIGQMLLMGFERLKDGPFVVFDTETGGRNPNTCELVEVACVRWENGEPAGGFRSYVRPSGPGVISAGSLKVHGITWPQVADAPLPAEVVPRVLAAFGDDIVAGHNIEQFDLVLLRRYCGHEQIGLEAPAPPVVDTVAIARRLYPDAPSRRLEDFIAAFGLSDAQTHQAEDDALLNGEVLHLLIDVIAKEKELHALGEALPLVAASIRAAGIPVRDDVADLVLAGARAHRLGQDADLLSAWADASGEDGQAAVAWLAEAGREGEPTPDDLRWQEMESRWRQAAAGFTGPGGDRSLRAFLRYAALAESIDVAPGAGVPDDDARALPQAGRVAMMSVHTAKGKEWPVVIVIGVETGQFPMENEHTTPAELEEERRVMYVAVTRAKERLFLSWATSGPKGPCGMSPYVRDLCATGDPDGPA